MKYPAAGDHVVQKPRFQIEKHLRNSFETLFQFVWIVVEWSWGFRSQDHRPETWMLGEILGFRFELCWFSPSYLALFCVSVFSLFCFSSVAIIHWHIRCHHACHSNCWLRSHSSVFCSVCFGCGCVFFVCLCASFLVWFVFDGIANWTLYWSITSAFEAIDKLTALHANLQFIFFAAVERV